MAPRIPDLSHLRVSHVNDPQKAEPEPRVRVAAQAPDLASIWDTGDEDIFTTADEGLADLWAASQREESSSIEFQDWDFTPPEMSLPRSARYRVDRIEQAPRPVREPIERPQGLQFLPPQITAPPPPAPPKKKSPMERAAEYVRQTDVFDSLADD